jgi:mono/diheme cytochrome c family protein
MPLYRDRLRRSALRSWIGVVAALLLALPLGAGAFAQQGEQPAWGTNPWEPGKSRPWNLDNLTPGERKRLLRHQTFMNREVPEGYLATTNDVGYTTRAIAEGGPLYLAHCQKCHGASGLGNGELAMSLTPSPALLAYLVQQPIAVDQYLLWTISEGGQAFGTAMPAFKKVLSQDEIWEIVAYLRAGLPMVEPEGGTSEPQGAPPVTSEPPPPPASGK